MGSSSQGSAPLRSCSVCHYQVATTQEVIPNTCSLLSTGAIVADVREDSEELSTWEGRTIGPKVKPEKSRMSSTRSRSCTPVGQGMSVIYLQDI